jgi:hypothetical protein
MIQVTIGRGDELEGAQADVVHSLVVSWKLEALQAVARLGLLADDELGALGVVALDPAPAEDEVVEAEELTEEACTGLQINQDITGNVTLTGDLVLVNVNALQLEIGVSMVGSGGVDTMLVGHDLPEFGTGFPVRSPWWLASW